MGEISWYHHYCTRCNLVYNHSFKRRWFPRISVASNAIPSIDNEVSHLPVDLKTRKTTGTSCQIETLFRSKLSIKFLIKYNLLCFLISGRLLTNC